MDQVIHFVMRHWLLSLAFVVVLIAIIIEEMRSKVGMGDRISPQKAVNLINRESAVVVDLRDNNAYKDGHIIDAVNIASSTLDQKDLKKLQTHKKVPVILMGSNDQKAAIVAKQLRGDGFEKPMILMGGLGAWNNASLPTVKG